MAVRFGDVAKIQGGFVPSGSAKSGRRSRFCRGRNPVFEQGHFVGRIAFHGEGGYLSFRVDRAQESVARSFKLRCEHGHADHFRNDLPGLFGYIQSPVGTFSDTDGTILDSRIREKHRVIEFDALRHLHEQSATFKAGALEWLPGEVAASRWVEVARVGVETFMTAQPTTHPESARVDPPFPFSGEATYSRPTHSLEGDLTVSVPGLDLPLAGATSKAGLCVFTRNMLNRVCDSP